MSVTSQFTTFSTSILGPNATRSQITQADPKSQAKRAVNMAPLRYAPGDRPIAHWGARSGDFDVAARH